MSTSVTIDEQQYSIGKLDAMRQFHVNRRIGPIIVAMFKGQDLRAIVADAESKAKFDFGKFLNTMGAGIADALAAMPDEQIEHIIWPCMSVVKVQQGPAWADIKVPGQNRFMFEFVDSVVMLRLTVEVLKVNLGNFFSGLMKSLPANATSEETKA